MRCCVFFSTFLFAALQVFTGCGESISPVCGDNTAQGIEVCDGTDLAGEDCVSQGFTGGTLSCLADCSGFDTSLCTGAPVCGDNVAEGTEVCDGTDLAGEDCVSQGFTGGTLACLGDCSGFDTTGCTSCTLSGAFEFVHPTGSYSSVQDCITADVCVTRGYAGPLYNAAGIAPAEYPRDFVIQWPGDSEEPTGTRWAPTDCASAQPSDFTTFVAALQFDVGNNVLTTPLCLSIPAANLFYDVDFSAWEMEGGGAFTYTRTAASPDECHHGDAICGTACGCPDGFVVDASSGNCRLPDPCDPNPCGSGASCRRLGIADHVCECDTVEFSNEGGSCDSITPSVCIARGPTMGLFNSADEPGYNDVAECVSPSPTLTEWASLPCTQATNADFGTWVSSTFMELPFCTPPQMLGVPACVRLTDGSNQEWDIRMTDWCIGAFRGGGCFSYIRSHNVADGQACGGTGGTGGSGG